jgi:hypothetical protein
VYDPGAATVGAGDSLADRPPFDAGVDTIVVVFVVGMGIGLSERWREKRSRLTVG